MSEIKLLNMDCMELLRQTPDKYYDLCVCDPPYGNNLNGGCSAKNGWNPNINWDKCNKGWNINIPLQSYFDELRRVSSNQIIWGGNYFANMLPNSECWIIWDKGQRDFSLADGELAWASFDKAVRIKTLYRAVANQEVKIHPTQKPVKLYEWLLTNYAKPGDRILDTHGGSMSSAIACHNLGYDLTLCELDEDYYKAGVARFEQHKAQGSLFTPSIHEVAIEQRELI